MSAADDVNGVESDGRIRRLAVLGQPIAHSLSPRIHNAALAHLGMDSEWVYEAIELAPEEFAERTRSLPVAGFVGANVTVPHKHAALAIADEATERAREIGAANTLSFSAGSIRVDNTDAPGFLAALPQPPGRSHALVLGAGGSARAVVWALRGAGAEVSVWNRTRRNAESLAGDLGGSVLASLEGVALGDFELVVNTTSVGLGGPSASDLDSFGLDPGHLESGHVVVDLVYGSSETELLRVARAAGASVIDGREILVRQGAESFRIWTGRDAPVEVMRRAAYE